MHLMRSAVIDAPVAEVWAVLRYFDSVQQWNPGVTEAVMEQGRAADRVGGIRRLSLPDGNIFRETLLALDDVARSFTYDIIESPLPVRDYVATQRFSPITMESRTYASWEANFEAAPENMTEMVETVGTGIFETGLKGMQDYFTNRSSR